MEGGRGCVCACFLFCCGRRGACPSLPGVLLVGFSVAVMEGMGGEEHDGAMWMIAVMVVADGDNNSDDDNDDNDGDDDESDEGGWEGVLE
jgi:hypothetical protein